MNRVQLDIARYCAWAPGLESQTSWQRWARGELPIAASGSPAVEFLPPMFRRRLSRLSRMALQVAHDCATDEGWVAHDGATDKRQVAHECASDARDLPTVFCSRHGELDRTVGLLLDQLRGEALSPTAFSMSVHNTASGLYTIDRGNTAPSNAVVAMADTLPVALIDAAAALAAGRCQQIMVVVAEEPVADIYHQFMPPEFAYAAAFLLVADSINNDNKSDRLTLSFERRASRVVNEDEQHGLALLRYLLLEQRTQALVLGGERLQWTFAA